MASGQGWTISFFSEGPDDLLLRQQYWIRYVDWLIFSPLVILALTVLSGISGVEILFLIVVDVSLILLVRTHMFQNVNDRDGPPTLPSAFRHLLKKRQIADTI